MNPDIGSPRNLVVGLGVLLLCTILFALSFIWEAGSASISRTYFARFQDVTGLNPGNPVRIQGVKTGFVGRLSVENGRAVVPLHFDRVVELRAGARASLRNKTMLGGKFIELFPGMPDGAPLPVGSSIPGDQSPLELDRMLHFVERTLPGLLKVLADFERSAELPDGAAPLGGRLKKVWENAKRLKLHLGRVWGNCKKALRLAGRLEAGWPQSTGRMESIVREARKLSARLDDIHAALSLLDECEHARFLQKVEALVDAAECIQYGAADQERLLDTLDRVLAALAAFDELFIRRLLQGEGCSGGLAPPAAGMERIEELEAAGGR